MSDGEPAGAPSPAFEDAGDPALDRIPERHGVEQRFFADETIRWAAAQAARFERPCCLCTPSVARALQRARRPATLLDLDTRFADHPGFQSWDLTRPTFVAGEPFDLIVIDPPFFGVSLRQLVRAVRLLVRHDPTTPLLLTYLLRRAPAIERAFADFGLALTDRVAAYRTTESADRNEIRWSANFPAATDEGA